MNLSFKSTKEERLLKAFGRNKARKVRALLDEGANVREVFAQNPALLVEAVKRNLRASVEVMLRSGQLDLSDKVMILVTKKGICRHANPLYRDQAHFSYWVEAFLAAGANFSGKDEHRRNFLQTVMQPYMGYTGCVDAEAIEIIKLLKRFPPEQAAAFLRHADAKGDTPLHYVMKGKFSDDVATILVPAFLEMGADPARKDAFDRTALEHAHAKGLSGAILALKGACEVPSPENLPGEIWRKSSDSEVCLMRELAEEGYRLTDIFNFALRERMSLAQNTRTNAETRETRSFDDFSDKTPLQIAYAQYKAQGGKIGVEAINGRTVLEKPRGLS